MAASGTLAVDGVTFSTGTLPRCTMVRGMRGGGEGTTGGVGDVVIDSSSSGSLSCPCSDELLEGVVLTGQ